nr:MFS-type transporter clz9-like [Hydra vulgaris]
MFVKHLIPFVDQNQKPILLLYDGHGSHLMYGTIKAAMDNHIQIVCLPPNCSHTLQPLDVAVFGQLKNEWRKILKRFSRETQHKNIDKTAFTGLLKQLWERLSPANAIAGFRSTGISPLSKEKMERRITGIDFLNQSPERYSPKSPRLQTPRSAIREALRSIICPNVSAETAAIIEQQKQKRKRVQAKCGELLTNEKVFFFK